MISKRGRKPRNRLTYIKRIAETAKSGISVNQAIKLSGISHETYYKWIREQPELAEIVDKATGSTELLLVKTAVDRAIETKNTKDILSVLEHLYPESYSPRIINQLQGANGDSVVFKVDASGGYIPPENVMGIASTLSTTNKQSKQPS